MRAIFKIIKAAADKVSEVKPPKKKIKKKTKKEIELLEKLGGGFTEPKKIISKEDKDRLDTLFNK